MVWLAYGGSIVGRIINAFESKYPFIKVKYLRLGGAARLFYDFVTSMEGQALFTEEGFISSHASVKPRFARLSLDKIKYPTVPDTKISDRIQMWLSEYQQTFGIPVRQGG